MSTRAQGGAAPWPEWSGRGGGLEMDEAAAAAMVIDLGSQQTPVAEIIKLIKKS